MLKKIKDFLSRKTRKAPPGVPSSDSPAARDDVASRSGEKRPKVTVGPKVVHRPIDPSDLDIDAVKIVQRLTRFDHAAYLVGGCVRDLLLERRPKDFDIGTSATPRQIKRLFRNSRIIGRRFRLAHIYFHEGKIIEVATFRSRNGHGSEDGSTEDKDLLIREDNQFGTPEEDALRRDFTINALFYDVNKKTVLDHTDGLGDLRRRLVRTIGDADVRFQEDPIRILRAIKFAARLDFQIEAKTLEALKRTTKEIPRAASARVLEEINRFCRGGAGRQSFVLLREHGVFEVILPEFAKEYRNRDDAWKLLEAFLQRIDERQNQGLETPTGAILAVLLIPILRDELGWTESGEATPPSGLDLRAAVDKRLRPAAVRLRMARKDQELCRQIILTLYRMVPPRRARRNTRRSILRRECLPQTLWILDVLGSELGGQFSDSYRHWKRAADADAEANRDARGPGKPARTADSEKNRDGEGGAKKRSRSGRSRGRGRGRGRGRSGDQSRPSGQDTKPAPQAKAKKAKDDSMPPPWDDDYFFAALPTAPTDAQDDGQGDRYGASGVAAAGPQASDAPASSETRPAPKADRPPVEGEEGAAAPSSAAQDGGTSRSRSRRRRRPRRRKRPAGQAAEGDGGSADKPKQDS